MSDHVSRLRSALFVDFDNIYISLEHGGGDAADRFAREPLQWVTWLERRLGLDGVEADAPDRRLLVRRVYLNPQRFNRFRAHFIRSGFEVIDTPPLTMQGKTSADTHMVLDILDTLAHETRFDEFIVFSGDADFTPLLLRLRKHDRRTAVLAIGPSSAAYKAACDLLIDEERFLEEALGQVAGIVQPSVKPSPDGGRPSQEVLARIGHRLDDLVELTGALEPWQLPQIYKEFAEFSTGTNWLGFFSLKAMTEAIIAAVSDRLMITGDDDWRIEPVPPTGDAAAVAPSDPTTPTAVERPAALSVPLGVVASSSGRPAEIGEFVREKAAESPEPLVLATLAQWVIDRFGDQVVSSRWLGAGSFKNLLARLDLGGLALSHAMPGYLYDPARHPAPNEEERKDGFAEAEPELAELARTVHDLTDTPYLSPEAYAVVLRQIARELEANGFHLTTTSKAVRDRCHERGISIARSDISFLLKGLSFSGYRFHGTDDHDPAAIGRMVAHNTILLCQRAQMELSDEDERRIERWIVGGLDAEPGPGEATGVEEAGAGTAGDAGIAADLSSLPATDLGAEEERPS